MKFVIGLLASVDSGKTTLSESLLFEAGVLRSMGRVDHGDAFLDTDQLEKQRGITIYSKQAILHYADQDITLLDTPGHVDFGAEMERALMVMDGALLIVNGSDGITGHTETLWQLLQRYRIPTILFFNKMDLPDIQKEELLRECQNKWHENFVDFSLPEDALMEEVSLCDEQVLEEYMESGRIGIGTMSDCFMKRKLFPCLFGSALKNQGVREILEFLNSYVRIERKSTEFAARVFKIARDGQGKRWTYLKIESGRLSVKQLLEGEKINQIRLYSGVKYTAVDQAEAGELCAVQGLEKTRPGQGFGKVQEEIFLPSLTPVLNYRILYPEEISSAEMARMLKELEEENPELQVSYQPATGNFHLRLMGHVQTEILQQQFQLRYGIKIGFGPGEIVYLETIAATVEGVGHFEPLRHYAEVHLLMEPGERGSGLQFAANCSEDMLDRNWQRLILTHLEEKIFPGVLTGSAITDIKITVVAGRAHTKHTEGGDFRQATYRAVRQGLMQAGSILLEPYYKFRLQLPAESMGRAMSDLTRMGASFAVEEQSGEFAQLSGRCRVAAMENYATELAAYTKGTGRMQCRVDGYDVCVNQEDVVAEIGYDWEKDTDNTPDSVFCAHGAGFIVPWNQVEEYMHIEKTLQPQVDSDDNSKENLGQRAHLAERRSTVDDFISQEEIEEIYQRTFGTSPRTKKGWERSSRKESISVGSTSGKTVRQYSGEEYLLVDGYNIIFAWPELASLAAGNLESARGSLMDILCDYQGYRGCKLILVFDAYKVVGNPGSVMDYHNIHVVYTKEAETADMYIERVTHEIGRKHKVTVATSDGAEQMIILGEGALRMSARELKEEIEASHSRMRENYLDRETKLRNYLLTEPIETDKLQ